MPKPSQPTMVKIKFEDKIKRNMENTNTNRRTLKREKTYWQTYKNI